MAKYWVNLGSEILEEGQETNGELEALANHWHDVQREFVTENLEEAKEVSEKAKSIYKKLGYVEDLVGEIKTQPECPVCCHYGRFSDSYCPKCGAKLRESQYE